MLVGLVVLIAATYARSLEELKSVLGDEKVVAFSVDAAERAFAEGKHIVFSLVDDGGFEYEVFGAKGFGNGSQTPNLNAFAKSGTVFTEAYTAVSSCSPSRSAILSGQPSHQNGMFGLHNMEATFNSHLYLRSLTHILRENGYYTGAIGKYHLGLDVSPTNVPWSDVTYRQYPFDYGVDIPECCSATNACLDKVPYNEMSRNITRMRDCFRSILEGAKAANAPSFSYIAWGDAHRCGSGVDPGPDGAFCELYGNGMNGQPKIPDWNPVYYDPDQVQVPWHIPDSPEGRNETAKQWTAINRIDQGFGLMMQVLREFGIYNNTLIMHFSDNGIPEVGAKTQYYRYGMGEPLFVRSPTQSSHGIFSDAFVSSLDFVPTILDYAGIGLPKTQLDGSALTYTGSSILPILDQPHAPPGSFDHVFLSHNLHGLSHWYPSRVFRNATWLFAYNAAAPGPMPILDDVFHSATFNAMLEAEKNGQPTGWYRNLTEYRWERPAFELFHIPSDPKEIHNLAYDPAYAHVLSELANITVTWCNITFDPYLSDMESGAITRYPITSVIQNPN